MQRETFVQISPQIILERYSQHFPLNVEDLVNMWFKQHSSFALSEKNTAGRGSTSYLYIIMFFLFQRVPHCLVSAVSTLALSKKQFSY